ncbi:esterase family protein [uncultured Thomasclavelia sp.]|uniref:alpha/beta hydrolase n=1 Tax=uncultured Thomasclavelia sp. TaxID=3025759 RepID=UPI0025CF65A9|nr:alpha/beta hydrolase-fold protein [uncultured Thomasclavelia sp.]
MKCLKKALSVLAVITLVMTLIQHPIKVEATTELTSGVTISENTDYPNSDAHYQVQFTYKATSVDVTSVSIVGNFTFYTDDQAKIIMDGREADYYTPYEYKEGMFQTGYAVSEMGYAPLEMENMGDGYFQITLPLPGCQYFYGFVENGDMSTIYKDPTNLPVANGDSDSGWSLIYVGNASDCLEGQEYIYPRADGKTGTIEFVEYTATDGTTQPLGVYLPYNYDSSKKYPTLYVSHGGGGNEVEWLYIGAAANIMDNLIAENEVEETIVVTMDNSYFNWDMEITNRNLVENIIPYVEANYSVLTDKENRAIAGLSNGGYTVVNEMIAAQDSFGYYGIFSPNYRAVEVLENATEEQLKAMAGSVYYECSGTVDNGMGRQDRYGTVNTVYETLLNNGADVTLEWKNGAHDWGIWRAALSTFVKDYLWTVKDDNKPITPEIPSDDQTVTDQSGSTNNNQTINGITNATSSNNAVKTGDNQELIIYVVAIVISTLSLAYIQRKQKTR